MLGGLVTDTWVDSSFPVGWFNKRMGERHHSDLARKIVYAPTLKSVADEILFASRGLKKWPKILERNERFQRNVSARIEKFARKSSGIRTVFAYSYAARHIFRHAKRIGWTTVLGQIDPGPYEAKLVKSLYQKENAGCTYEGPPAEYWDRWREETHLADVILANSEWAREALISEGVESDKIIVGPLAYEPEPVALAHGRNYPTSFSAGRPMKVLFLGQVILRKGIGPLLEAIRNLHAAPIEFHFVGEAESGLPMKSGERVKFHGAVPRSAVHNHYQNADVFIFPTMSDGFGITQLEALSWGLPVIASKNCGKVVTEMSNGVLLNTVSPESIERALLDLAASAELVGRLSAMTRSSLEHYTLRSLANLLVEVAAVPDRLAKLNPGLIGRLA